jgi:hypothetical protein
MAADQSEGVGMTADRMDATPPEWAEWLLRLALKRADRESVSGDLLEEYRDAVVPARGRAAADAWYVRQMCGFMWRATWMWAALFSGAFVARQAVDLLIPTHDFALRAQVTTYTGVALMAATSFWSAWRSGSFASGVVVTIVMSQIAAVFSVIGVTLLLAIWHDPATLKAAADSGGVGEAYVLPFIMIVPAVIVGSVAAAVGSVGSKVRRVDAA